MTEIKNANGKLVCKLDQKSRTIEIVSKGFKTSIRFLESGELVVLNEKSVS